MAFYGRPLQSDLNEDQTKLYQKIKEQVEVLMWTYSHFCHATMIVRMVTLLCHFMTGLYEWTLSAYWTLYYLKSWNK